MIVGKQREFENLLTELKDKYKSDNIELEQCPQGYLITWIRNDKPVYFQTINENSRRKRISINKRPEIINGLVRKRYIKEESKVLLNNIKAIEKLLTQYCDSWPDYILSKLGAAERKLPEAYFFSKEAYMTMSPEGQPGQAEQTQEATAWQNQPYEQSGYRAEARVHTTSRGLKVRSKSELMIAEKLYEYDVPFRYEQVLYIGEKQIIPDFTVRKRDGSLVYWEHCGLTNSFEYMKHHKGKVNLYEKAGIVPWKNLIITYDDEFGNINMGIIESEITNKLT